MFRALLSVLFLLVSGYAFASLETRGLLQLQIPVVTDSEASFLEGGTGLLRHGDDSDMQLAHALLEVKGDLTDHISFTTVINASHEPTSHAGFTQLFLRYKPIWSPKYRWQFRAGMFYPEMGFENPDIGWLSPYAYTNSAINSWVGEELRTLGAEFKVTRPGRAHGQSPHTFGLSGAFYKGNDPTGTILAWRGWGLHDRQSLTNERLFFADYPSLREGQALAPQAEWVEPYREIDGRWGYQMGLHWDYQRKSRVRYYYYNNNADETVLARGGQYAWHTIFHSLAWQYRFDRNWRLIARLMDGSTAMGPAAVKVDFDSWFVLLNYRDKSHSITLRYDWFETTDRDSLIPFDDNNGQGSGVTAAYRYTLNSHWQLGAEFVYIDSEQASRTQWPGRSPSISQNQLMGVLQYRF